MTPKSLTNKSSVSNERIQWACKALEEALSNFEKTDSDDESRRREQLLKLKSQLNAIRTQLDDLSK